MNTHRINESAMLVSLNISQWRAYKSDKKITAEVAVSHGSDASMGKYRKSLLAREALAAIQKIAGAARDDHYTLTLPWADEGRRILSNAGYWKYNDTMGKHRQSFWNEVNNVFRPNYQAHVDNARVLLNGLFNENEYPSESAVVARFGFVISVNPIPDAVDFRVDLGDVETARIKSEMETSVQATIETAVKDVWARLSKVVGHMSERLHGYSVSDTGVSGAFRDSLVQNIIDLLDIVPALNITDDQTLVQFAARIRSELTAYSPEELRDNESLRTDTARRADEILSKMAGYLS